MSNPFSLFRKNQKAWIAGLTVAVMIGFGVLPVVMQMMGGGPQQGAAANPVVFTINDGPVRASDMDQLRRQRAVINQFYENVGGQSASLRPLPMTDGAIADSYLFAKKAEKWGIVVDDAAVNAYIHQITDKNSKDIREALAKMTIDRTRVTEGMLFNALRHELAASQARSLYAMRTNQNSFGDTPAQMWEYYSKLNRRAKIEAIGLEVANYLDKVKDPSDAEVEAFFEKYRDRLAAKDVYYLNRLLGNANVEGVVLESPTPGFYQPARAKFQYVVADYDAIRENVTDKEVEKYYEDNKDAEFVEPFVDDEPPTEADEPAKDDTGDEKDADPTKDDSTKDAPADDKDAPADDKDKPADEPTEPVKPEDKDTKKTGDAEKTDAASDEEKPADTEKKQDDPPLPADDEKTPAKEAEATDQSGRSQSVTSLITGTDDPEGSNGEDLKDEGEAEKAEPADGDEGAKADEEPKTTGAAGEKDPPKKEDKTPDDPAQDDKKKDEAEPKEDGKEKKDRPKTYEPLDSVRDQIRNKLTEQRIKELETKAFKELTDKMARFGARYERDTADNIKVDMTENPLTEEAVKKYGLTLKTTPWVSASELSEREGFGTSFVTTTLFTNQGQRQDSLPCAQAAFDEVRPVRQRFLQLAQQFRQFPIFVSGMQKMDMFQPRRAQDRDRDGLNYLFWKVEENPAHEPELNEVRDEVVRTWKSGRGADEGAADDRALALATKAAQAIADEARQRGRSLAEIYGSTESDGQDKASDDETKEATEGEDAANDEKQGVTAGDKDETGDAKEESGEVAKPKSNDQAKPGEKPDSGDTEKVDASEHEVLEPWSFSWMTKSPQGGPVVLNSNIPGLDQPGPEFMKTVFGMEIGDVGVATNHPENVVYVVRVDSLDPNEQTLQERFTRADPRQLSGAASFDLEDRQQALGEALRKEFNLEWSVPEAEAATQ